MTLDLSRATDVARPVWIDEAAAAGGPPAVLRTAEPDDAPGIFALVATHREEGHLLPRTLADITSRAPRFVVAERDGVIVGCAELAPLGAGLAEIRSLVVDDEERGAGLGRGLIGELWRRGQRAGFDRLCAFTHQPAYFLRMGFSIVPHIWLSAKVLADCVHCPLFRTCGQYAVLAAIDPTAAVPPVARA
ncbi:MAG TPA: GNAT family N-acetyltransferase [Vicinamibacterales bacterium]|nr:GNAT family N-acetyltransferase [Vicinamibacterales bacterium]